VKIGIIGHGVVGGALAAWFTSRGVAFDVYDPPHGIGTRAGIDAADAVFICVPTPYAPGGIDGRYLEDAVSGLGGAKLVVIKSTVPPGTTDALQARFPQHRFVFNPEFLREAHAIDDMAHPDRQIIGVTEQSRGDADALLALLPPAPFVRVCGAREAELAKYAANSFLAVKVSFANELHDLCARLGIGYDGVRDIVGADARIGSSHLDALAGGYRGYGGKCLPKDSMALLDIAAAANVPLAVLGAAHEVNARLRPPARRAPRAARHIDDVAPNEQNIADRRAA
jgi:UDPglucose 6-dehydrogenase